MDDSDESDDDFAVMLSDDGRVYGSIGACLTTPAVWDGLVAVRGALLDEFRAVAQLAAWPLAASAFWLSANDSPSNALEKLAMRIFDFHTENASPPIDRSRCGCEWWCNVTRSELLSTAGAGDIGFHFDKDEHAYSKYGLVVHPLLSTVTYLTDEGAPTIVFPDLGLSAATGGSYQRLTQCTDTQLEALLVPPRVGRHVRFDGRALHGAPAVYCPHADGSVPYERVSFCVNIWVGHRPAKCPRFTSGLQLMGCAEAPPLRHAAARRVPSTREAKWHPLVVPGPALAQKIAGKGTSERSTTASPGWEHGHQFRLEQVEKTHVLKLPHPQQLSKLLRGRAVVSLRGGIELHPAGSEVEVHAVADEGTGAEAASTSRDDLQLERADGTKDDGETDTGALKQRLRTKRKRS